MSTFVIPPSPLAPEVDLSGPNMARVYAHREELKELLAGYGLVEPRIFGSSVHNEDGPDSDIDILVKTTRVLDLMELARAEIEAGKLLGRRVEIALDGRLIPFMAPRIYSEAVAI